MVFFRSPKAIVLQKHCQHFMSKSLLCITLGNTTEEQNFEACVIVILVFSFDSKENYDVLNLRIGLSPETRIIHMSPLLFTRPTF